MAKPWHEVKVSKDDPEREARLAQALRENLRRRKAQARSAEQRALSPNTPAPDPADRA